MNKQALIKLAQVRLAINYVLRQRMEKQAEGDGWFSRIWNSKPEKPKPEKSTPDLPRGYRPIDVAHGYRPIFDENKKIIGWKDNWGFNDPRIPVLSRHPIPKDDIGVYYPDNDMTNMIVYPKSFNLRKDFYQRPIK